MSLFSERFLELRTKKDVSQDQCAEQLGVKNRATISNYERGKTEPNLDDLLKIADYFKVSVDWLLGRNGAEKHYIVDEDPEEQTLIEQFKISSEALLREKGNLTEEKIEYTLKFMEFTFRQDLEREKKEGK